MVKDGTLDKDFRKEDQLDSTVFAYNIGISRVSSSEEMGKALKIINVDFIALAEVNIKTKRSENKD